jgi:large repetitive protein
VGFDPVSSVVSQTQFNTITQNSIISTSGLGIDIAPSDTVNQGGTGDPNINQGIDVPLVTVDAGQLTATTCAGCVVEVFAATTAVGSFGPGSSYIATATADAGGTALLGPPATGWPAVVTATTTTPEGSTSEFAANVRAADATPPGAPGTPTATGGTSSAMVSFAPAAANGSPVTTYTVTATDITNAANGNQQASGPASPITVAGLTNGHLYTFTVTATNSAGTGPGSVASNAVTPTAAGGVTLTTLVPRALGQGASNRQVKVNGSGFVAGAAVTISGTGASVKSLVVTSPTVLTLQVSVAANAAPGNRDVSVTSGGGIGSCTACFTVDAAPTITSVTPASIAQGQTNIPIDLGGTNFNTGIIVAVSGVGVTVGTIIRIDTSHMRVFLTTTATAALGARSITLTNTDVGFTTTANAITVTA